MSVCACVTPSRGAEPSAIAPGIGCQSRIGHCRHRVSVTDRPLQASGVSDGSAIAGTGCQSRIGHCRHRVSVTDRPLQASSVSDGSALERFASFFVCWFDSIFIDGFLVVGSGGGGGGEGGVGLVELMTD